MNMKQFNNKNNFTNANKRYVTLTILESLLHTGKKNCHETTNFDELNLR